MAQNMNVGYVFTYARQYDRAIEQGRKLIEMEPRFHGGYTVMGYAYNGKQMYKEAEEVLQKSIALGGGVMALNIITGSYARMGKVVEAHQGLNKILEVRKQKYVPAYFIAAIYAGLGEADTSFEWLERAYEERNGFLIFLGVEHAFYGLHPDPRFKDLLQRIGLKQ
jgi:serine/threonine-protein kinase